MTADSIGPTLIALHPYRRLLNTRGYDWQLEQSEE
jgi:hypothetical protein